MYEIDKKRLLKRYIFQDLRCYNEINDYRRRTESNKLTMEQAKASIHAEHTCYATTMMMMMMTTDRPTLQKTLAKIKLDKLDAQE